MPALLHAEDRLTASAGEKELRGLIAHPDPEYPEAAMEQLLEGEGLFKIVFDPATGRAAKVTVEKSTGHPLLDAAATKGMMRWRSKPQQLTVLSVTYSFGLYDPKVKWFVERVRAARRFATYSPLPVSPIGVRRNYLRAGMAGIG